MRKITFLNQNHYHVFNRGVDKREIFLEARDYSRFLRMTQDFSKSRYITDKKGELIKIVGYCLMPNHFHFILRQEQEEGISKFMQRLGTGYTLYFNKKNERAGVLMSGVFKAKAIENDVYLLQVLKYIHWNPGELFRVCGEPDQSNLLRDIVDYRWSSMSSYLNPKVKRSVDICSEVILGQFRSQKDFNAYMLKET